MTHINRQKYMAELSKLLAFMFKEDKEDILAQYNKMLDESDDEQALLESFGSPTKLAVTISRTYKRSERKLAVEADSKEDKPAETEPIFVTPVKKEKTAEARRICCVMILMDGIGLPACAFCLRMRCSMITARMPTRSKECAKMQRASLPSRAFARSSGVYSGRD